MTIQVTPDGERLIKNWLANDHRIQMRKIELQRLEREAEESKIALAKWMLPADALFGEKICVWYGDSLIQVEVETGNHYHVTVRKRGRSLNEENL